MMNTMFLTADELKQLTGYQLASHQIVWLQRNAIPFFINRLKRPVVVREAVNICSGIKQTTPSAFELGQVD